MSRSPIRAFDDPGAPAALRSFLAEQALTEPLPDDVRERVRQRLVEAAAVGVGAALIAGATSHVASATSTGATGLLSAGMGSLSLKVIVAVTLIAAPTVVAVERASEPPMADVATASVRAAAQAPGAARLRRGPASVGGLAPEPPAPPAASAAPQVSAAPSTEGPPPAVDPPALAHSPAAAHAAAARPAAVSCSDAAPATNLAEDAALLGRARQAVESAPSDAARLLDEHVARFPCSPLAAERAAIRVRLELRRGDDAEARRHLDALERDGAAAVYAPRASASSASGSSGSAGAHAKPEGSAAAADSSDKSRER